MKLRTYQILGSGTKDRPPFADVKSMSCNELSNRHLAVCLIPMIRDSVEDLERVAKVLRSAMSAALTSQYGASAVEEHSWPTRRDVMHECGQHSPIAVVKALQCYAYQASDMPGWESSEACQMYRLLLNRALARMPGYEDAAWSIV